jgi:hypothetical protein
VSTLGNPCNPHNPHLLLVSISSATLAKSYDFPGELRSELFLLLR